MNLDYVKYGFIQGDGCTSRLLSTTHKEKKVLFSNGEYLCKESYDLNIGNNIGKKYFLDNIGFVHTYKMDALKLIVK